jgi:hypothetical protein
MRGLSLTQPWATLVAIGAKKIETRSWSTPYRGDLAIHATKGFPDWAVATCLEEPFRPVLKAAGVGMPADLSRGVIVAVARLADVLPIVEINGKMPRVRCVGLDDEAIARVWDPTALAGVNGHVGDIQPNEHEAAFGDYTPGRFGWLLEDLQALPEPIPCRGYQGLWTVAGDVEAQIWRHLAVSVAR